MVDGASTFNIFGLPRTSQGHLETGGDNDQFDPASLSRIHQALLSNILDGDGGYDKGGSRGHGSTENADHNPAGVFEYPDWIKTY